MLQKVESLRAQLVLAQDQKAQHPSDPALVHQENMLHQEFIHWNRAAQQYMSQKAKEDWILQGDTNSKFFHSLTKQKHYHRRIYSITSNSGEIITDYPSVVQQFRDYYVSMLGSSSSMTGSTQASIIDEGAVLTVPQQLALLKPISEAVIRDAIWSIPIHKSPAPMALAVVSTDKPGGL